MIRENNNIIVDNLSLTKELLFAQLTSIFYWRLIILYFWKRNKGFYSNYIYYFLSSIILNDCIMLTQQIFKRYYLSNSIFINKLYITMNKINLFDTKKHPHILQITYLYPRIYVFRQFTTKQLNTLICVYNCIFS